MLIADYMNALGRATVAPGTPASLTRHGSLRRLVKCRTEDPGNTSSSINNCKACNTSSKSIRASSILYKIACHPNCQNIKASSNSFSYHNLATSQCNVVSNSLMVNNIGSVTQLYNTDMPPRQLKPYITSPPPYNATTSPSYHATTSPSYQAATSPSYHPITSPSYHATTSPSYQATTSTVSQQHFNYTTPPLCNDSTISLCPVQSQ